MTPASRALGARRHIDAARSPARELSPANG